MRRWAGILVIMLTVLTIASQTICVHAAQQAAYEVEKYDYRATVTKAHTLEVEEKISVNLSDNFTELSFSLPSGNYLMTGLKVNDANFRAVKQNNVQMVTITDTKQLTKGHHTYTISYNVMEFVDRDPGKDILFFDVLHPGWTQPITALTAKVVFPDDFPWNDIQYYAGQFGVQNVETKVNFNADQASHTVRISANRIPENFGITLKSNLPDGYWEGALDGTWAIRLGLAFTGAVIIALLIMWFVGGRDPRIRKNKQSHPIEGISPVEMGYIFIERVRMRDITALITYLGTKGYLKISEYAPKKYRLIRKEEPAGEAKFIRSAYDTLFEDVPRERWVDMNEMISRLQRIRATIEEDVAAGFRTPDMMAYTPLSRLLRIIGIVLLSLMTGATCLMKYLYMYTTPNYLEAVVCAALTAITLVLVCNQFDKYYHAEQRDFTLRLILLIAAFAAVPVYIAVRTTMLTMQWPAAVLMLALTLLGGLLVAVMRSRAKGNAELVSKFLQLRHFIYHPDAKDIAENTFADINYFYEIVPYALLFNGLESWAITFASLNIPAPEWYSDDIEGNAISNLRTETETIVDYARDIKAFARTIENATTLRRHK